MIDRLIPKYPLFLVLGFAILAFSLFFLTAGRDAMIVVWANKLFDGETDQTIFKTTQIADKVIGNTLTTLLFVGLSQIMLGIGFAIAIIVRNLRRTGRATIDSYSSAGVAEADATRFEEPWFGRWFPRLLLSGVLVVLFFFLVTLWWDANTVFLNRAQFAGHTSGGAYESYVMIDRVLGPIINAGKFVGVGLVILGIATGLATIITHLSFQARALPLLTRKAMGQADTGLSVELPRPTIPAGFVAVAILGATLLVLSLPLAMVESGFGAWAQARDFDGFVSTLAVRTEGILSRSIGPLINMGMGLLFFAIGFLLLAIIRWLREQREGFGNTVADLSGGVIARPTIERPLWPTRLVAPLAVFGLVVVAFFFFTMTGVRAFNFDHIVALQSAGVVDSADFQNALRLDRILGPIIGATRFIGVGFLMLAIGLALVTIVINLRATGLLLPVGFSKLIPASRGEKVEEEKLTLDEPMALAPWDLLRPHLAGLAILVSATLPVIVLLAISIHRNLEQQFAGLGESGAASGLFKSSFLSVQLFGASWQPWMFFGMGLILFAIGRFFSTVVSFVEARRMVIEEGTSSIAEAVSAKAAAPVKARRQRTVGKRSR